MRLIDTDAIKLPEGFFESVDNVPKFYEWLNTLPTIDPVKHGWWEHRMLTSYPAKAICICNLCGQVMEREYFYCPHCGAKMERSEDATD